VTAYHSKSPFEPHPGITRIGEIGPDIVAWIGGAANASNAQESLAPLSRVGTVHLISRAVANLSSLRSKDAFFKPVLIATADRFTELLSWVECDPHKDLRAVLGIVNNSTEIADIAEAIDRLNPMGSAARIIDHMSRRQNFYILMPSIEQVKPTILRSDLRHPLAPTVTTVSTDAAGLWATTAGLIYHATFDFFWIM